MSHYNAKEIETFLKEPISSVSVANTGDYELLNYYRIRCDNLEPMRTNVLRMLDNLRYSAEETHKISWESKKRKDEINELNQVLHNLNRDLADERENFARLAGENSQLDSMHWQNEHRLARLNGKVEPVEQEIEFSANRHPQTIQKYVNRSETQANKVTQQKQGKNQFRNTNWQKTMNKSSTKMPLSSSTNQTNSNSNTFGNTIDPLPKGPKNTIKTVFLPNEQINNLGIEIDILRNQRETDKRFYEQEIQFLEEEKARRQNEFYTKSVSDKEKVEFLQNKLEQRQFLFENYTKDLLSRRAVCKNKEYQYVHALNQLKLENEVLEKQASEVSKKAVNEAENCYRLSELRTEDLMDKFRSQSMKAQNQLKKAKEEHNMLQNAMESRTNELENQLGSQLSMYRQLERKRENDLEEFMERINDLKGRMREFDGEFAQKYGDYINDDQREDLMRGLGEIKHDIKQFQRDVKEKKRDSNLGVHARELQQQTQEEGDRDQEAEHHQRYYNRDNGQYQGQGIEEQYE